MPTKTKKNKSVAKKKKVLKKKKVTKAVKKKVIAKAKKKAVKNILKKINVLGRVTHYYGHIGVAIVDLAAPLRLGDTVRIKHGDQEYPMTVTSMQIDHQPVAVAKKKDVIGMKTFKKVPPGAVVLPASSVDSY